jgi:hypothetical protein
MKRFLLIFSVVVGAALIAQQCDAGDRFAQLRASRMSWHGPYYDTEYGAPVAVLLPPTVKMQSSYSWGVAQTERYPVWPQFKRPYANPIGGGMSLRPTPLWPSHTDQFGDYYIRAPWGQNR